MMKKALLLIGAILLFTSIQAQIVSSRSVAIVSKTPSKTQWYLRGGLNLMNFAGDETDDFKNKIGYNFTYGFQKPIGSIGTYWGMEFGLGSRGYKIDEKDFDYSLMAHNIHYSPFTFGWKYQIVDNLKLDLHAGVYGSFDYTGKEKYEDDEEDESSNMSDWEDWNRFDVGMNIGAGIWFSNFNLDFTYQRGFLETVKDWETYSSNFMIRLGVTF